MPQIKRKWNANRVNPNSAGLLNVPFSESEIRKRHEILEH